MQSPAAAVQVADRPTLLFGIEAIEDPAGQVGRNEASAPPAVEGQQVRARAGRLEQARGLPNVDELVVAVRALTGGAKAMPKPREYCMRTNIMGTRL